MAHKLPVLVSSSEVWDCAWVYFPFFCFLFFTSRFILIVSHHVCIVQFCILFCFPSLQSAVSSSCCWSAHYSLCVFKSSIFLIFLLNCLFMLCGLVLSVSSMVSISYYLISSLFEFCISFEFLSTAIKLPLLANFHCLRVLQLVPIIYLPHSLT